MYCSECGKEIANNSKFCPKCGKEIISTESKNLKECSLCGKEEGTDSKCAKCVNINPDIKRLDNAIEDIDGTAYSNLSVWEKAKLSAQVTLSTGVSGVGPQIENYDNSSFFLRTLAGIICCITIYLIPAGISIFRDSHNSVLVFLLNLFLGWTVIGWLVALLLSASSESNQERKLRIQSYKKN